MSARFQDKVVIVTGGASGIGRATVATFAAEGARTAFCDVQDEAGRALADSLGRSAFYGHCDVANASDVEAFVAATLARFGRIDVLVNNAGVSSVGETPSLPAEEWHRVIAINLNSVFYFCREVIPRMRAQGSGAIVNIASTSGTRGDAGFSAYSATKGGLINYTRTLAIDHGKDGIRVNAVCPGPTLTPLAEGVLTTPEMQKIWMPVIPLRRYGRPEDIARAIAFLASEDAAFITGTTLLVDGGVTAQTAQPNLMPFLEAAGRV